MHHLRFLHCPQIWLGWSGGTLFSSKGEWIISIVRGCSGESEGVQGSHVLHPCLKSPLLPCEGPDFSIGDLPRIQAFLKFCKSYTEVLCLVFSSSCHLTKGEESLKTSTEAGPLILTLGFELVNDCPEPVIFSHPSISGIQQLPPIAAVHSPYNYCSLISLSARNIQWVPRFPLSLVPSSPQVTALAIALLTTFQGSSYKLHTGVLITS